MRYNLLFALVCLFMVSCKLPDQPKLTVTEASYAKELEVKFGCKVKREISPDYLKKLTKKSGYLLLLDEISCEYIDTANLSSSSEVIARDLYHRVLNNDTIYETITIVFSCKTGKDQYRTKSFDFVSSELH